MDSNYAMYSLYCSIVRFFPLSISQFATIIFVPIHIRGINTLKRIKSIWDASILFMKHQHLSPKGRTRTCLHFLEKGRKIHHSSVLISCSLSVAWRPSWSWTVLPFCWGCWGCCCCRRRWFCAWTGTAVGRSFCGTWWCRCTWRWGVEPAKPVCCCMGEKNCCCCSW